LTCSKQLPADKSHHQRSEQLKANYFWEMPSQTSPQVAAKATIRQENEQI